MKIVHRDVKPWHILWSSERNCFVLIDFDLAKVMKKAYYPSPSKPFGTRGFQAPELFQESTYCELVDIWGLGASVLWFLCELQIINKSYPSFQLNHVELCKLGKEAVISSEFCILQNMLQIDPKMRASAVSLLGHGSKKENCHGF